MKILVPIDGSKASLNAAKKAVETARKDTASIKFLTVVHEDFANSSGDVAITRGYLNEYNNETILLQGNKLLDSLMAQLDLSGIITEKAVVFGVPYMSISEIAKDENFDLIVMGNRGFSKIKRFFIGSVVQRVISEAPCPVLVVHTEADD
jgi:nucleotide-binding universal stress UspA family protein